MKVIGIIPARLMSTRLPEKPLRVIDGLPMIVHVYKRAAMCEALDELYVATDSEKIADEVKEHGGKVVITSENHKTGTDRVAEATAGIECDIVVNIQGDEPLVRPEHISKAVEAIKGDDNVGIVCLSAKSTNKNDSNEIKVVFDKESYVLYYSRADIPSNARKETREHHKQYCIYCFRKDVLGRFVNMEQTPLEKIEHIELLRAIENGIQVKNVFVDSKAHAVDTERDLDIVEKLMRHDDLRKRY